MAEKCEFQSMCLNENNNCDIGAADKCKEFKRKKQLLKEKCPIMIKHGYPDSLCDCDAFILRSITTETLPCDINENCIRALMYDKIHHILSKIIKNAPLSAEEFSQLYSTYQKLLEEQAL